MQDIERVTSYLSDGGAWPRVLVHSLNSGSGGSTKASTASPSIPLGLDLTVPADSGGVVRGKAPGTPVTEPYPVPAVLSVLSSFPLDDEAGARQGCKGSQKKQGHVQTSLLSSLKEQMVQMVQQQQQQASSPHHGLQDTPFALYQPDISCTPWQPSALEGTQGSAQPTACQPALPGRKPELPTMSSAPTLLHPPQHPRSDCPQVAQTVSTPSGATAQQQAVLPRALSAQDCPPALPYPSSTSDIPAQLGWGLHLQQGSCPGKHAGGPTSSLQSSESAPVPGWQQSEGGTGGGASTSSRSTSSHAASAAQTFFLPPAPFGSDQGQAQHSNAAPPRLQLKTDGMQDQFDRGVAGPSEDFPSLLNTNAALPTSLLGIDTSRYYVPQLVHAASAPLPMTGFGTAGALSPSSTTSMFADMAAQRLHAARRPQSGNRSTSASQPLGSGQLPPAWQAGNPPQQHPHWLLQPPMGIPGDQDPDAPDERWVAVQVCYQRFTKDPNPVMLPRSVIAQLGGDLERIKRELLDRKRRQVATGAAAVPGGQYMTSCAPLQQLLLAPVQPPLSNSQVPAEGALPSKPATHRRFVEQPSAGALQVGFEASHAAMVTEAATDVAPQIQAPAHTSGTGASMQTSPLKRSTTMPPLHSIMQQPTALSPPATCEQDPFSSFLLESPLSPLPEDCHMHDEEPESKRTRTCI